MKKIIEMKNSTIKNRSVYLLIFLFIFPSCESYLERQKDEALTFEKIWEKSSTTEKYLYNVYGFMPKESNQVDANPWVAASDEASFTYNRAYRRINNGSWNVASPPCDKWNHYYAGIREANVFMQNVESCFELEDTEQEQYKTEARFLRAYYYFMLVRMYGAVTLLGDEIKDPNSKELQFPRNTFEECVDYIVTEMQECSKILPEQQPDVWLGKPTKGVALSVIGRLTLYAARPLFNGNSLYKDVKNQDGTNLFPVEYDANKWKIAADANKKVIDLNIYKLYEEDNDPYKSYGGVFFEKWNSEIIFARSTGGYYWNVHCTPRAAGGTAYGGVSPTQRQVDSYAMANGRYPITGYNANGSPVIDKQSEYTEEGFSDFTHPIDQPNNGTVRKKSTFNMYINREPRFYASVLWSGADWIYMGRPKHIKVCDFSTNGNSGPGQSHDYPKPGYLIRKMSDGSLDTKNGQWGEFSWPLIRLAEIYLNYVEALNECDPSNPDILTYLNKIRKRAGVPNIEKVYPNAVGNKDQMRKLIRRERRVELAFETHRYFDTRTWMISEQTDNGDFYGMNVKAQSKNKSTPPDFWKRTVFETRVFEPKHYLYPIKQRELDRNKKIRQNYGW